MAGDRNKEACSSFCFGTGTSSRRCTPQSPQPIPRCRHVGSNGFFIESRDVLRDSDVNRHQKESLGISSFEALLAPEEDLRSMVRYGKSEFVRLPTITDGGTNHFRGESTCFHYNSRSEDLLESLRNSTLGNKAARPGSARDSSANQHRDAYKSFMVRDIGSKLTRQPRRSRPKSNNVNGLFEWDRKFAPKEVPCGRENIDGKDLRGEQTRLRIDQETLTDSFVHWKAIHRARKSRKQRAEIIAMRRNSKRRYRALKTVFSRWKQKVHLDIQDCNCAYAACSRNQSVSTQQRQACDSLLRIGKRHLLSRALDSWKDVRASITESAAPGREANLDMRDIQRLAEAFRIRKHLQKTRMLTRWKLAVRLSKVRQGTQSEIGAVRHAVDLDRLVRKRNSEPRQSPQGVPNEFKTAREKSIHSRTLKVKARSSNRDQHVSVAMKAEPPPLNGLRDRHKERIQRRKKLKLAYSRKETERSLMAAEDTNGLELRRHLKTKQMRVERARAARVVAARKLEADNRRERVDWHIRRALLWYRGIKPWKQYVVTQRDLRATVDVRYDREKRRRCFHLWVCYTARAVEARRNEYLQALKAACRHREKMLLYASWKAISSRYVQLRAKGLLVTQNSLVLKRKRVLNKLRMAYTKKLRLNCRVNRSGAFHRLQRSWICWSVFVATSRSRRLLELEKKQTWSRVRTWLAEAETLS